MDARRCQWMYSCIPCSQIPDLKKSTNGKMYCSTHHGVVEYVLGTSSRSTNDVVEWIPIKSSSSYNNDKKKNLSMSQPISPSGNNSDGSSGKNSPQLQKKKECNAKGCFDVDVKHVYQGYFCKKHEKVIEGYRVVIDQGKKDTRELFAREAEQNMRKMPHPLYQKEIDMLKKKIQKAESDFINTLFSSGL